MNSDSQIRK